MKNQFVGILVIALTLAFSACGGGGTQSQQPNQTAPSPAPNETVASVPQAASLPPNQTDAGIVINGVRWATRNVDAPGTFAENPQDAGMLFQWNRRQGWSATYPGIEGGVPEGWDRTRATGTAWYAENDPCPTGWRVPTRQELSGLQQTYTMVENWNNTGVNGALFGTAPNQIFLPAVNHRPGHRGGTLVDTHEGRAGRYWSNEPHRGAYAPSLEFGWHSARDGSYAGVNVAAERRSAISVRCVQDVE